MSVSISEQDVTVDVTENTVGVTSSEDSVDITSSNDDVSVNITEEDVSVSTTEDVVGISITEDNVTLDVTEGIVNLSGLFDVNLSSLTNNQFIKYDSATEKWVNTSSVDTNPTVFDDYTITATEIANKYVTLSQVPTNNQSIRVFVDNVGIKAEQGVDYSISGNQIFWTGYNFSSLLSLDDKLKIIYV
ncbi:MAG: hypothetical protein EOL95_09750 [Bacteroidia bacterium]|nr:hypothetical protein [Bacteroidia bacterium]